MKQTPEYLTILSLLFSAIVLGLIFTAYYAPELMVAITNHVWAMCGW